MEPESNNEIDLLLRRMARGNGAAHEGGVRSDDRHLDADELSSYAQNALPAAARARYMEHVADCATCRKVVTELSLSLRGAAITEPVETVLQPSGWKKFFASLFAPMVLRYAVPALGVIVVVVVGFIVLRRQGQQEFVAKLQDSRAVSPATPSATETPSSKGFFDSQSTETDRVKSQNAKAGARANSQTGVVDDRAAGAAGAAPAAVAPPAREEKLMAETHPASTADQPTPAVKTGAADTAPQQESVTIAKKQPETPKEKVEVAQNSENEAPRDQVANPGSAAQQATPTPSSTSGYSALRGLAGRRAETAKPAAAAKAAEAEKDSDKSTADEETRTVAGRRFRKQGNVWIDTAYESSTATVNMTRNSEQFRALVADEPAIGTIARQLDGEVIVVWKGHAYRIR
jgi:hypothetical protein